MIKIGFTREVDKLENLPKEVINAIEGITATLVKYYGDDRNIDEDMGGYISVIKTEEELYELKNDNMDVWESYPEYVDRIVVKNDKDNVEDWTNSLILCNNDFAISIIMPISITPQNFIDEME